MGIQGYCWDGDYLGEIELIRSTANKLVYLFVIVFCRCKRRDIVNALGISLWRVDEALEELKDLGLIEIDFRGRCSLSKKACLPLERFGGDVQPRPVWFSPPDD